MMSVDAFREGLDAESLAMIDALRSIVSSSCADLIEQIKWNAPSFGTCDADLITLGIERKGGVRLVLHRGAKPKQADGFHFDDVDGLAKWPASDRGVLTFRTLGDIQAKRDALSDLCRRWAEATT